MTTPYESVKKLIYGPIFSRRLGASLGVDIIPMKTCDYDCIYCQLGRTTVKTARIAPYISADEVISGLEAFFFRQAEGSRIDYITVAGSGEPTLNSEISAVISGIKEITEIPVAVLTNGSLLWEQLVAQACMMADLVFPLLDAGDERMFEKVNRPCREIDFKKMVEGIMRFSSCYKGRLWLEIMVIDRINSGDESIEKSPRLSGT